ncbi:MAG: glutamine-hydrolyzing GMP synthase subunit GuaA [Candidatus Hydrothermarchaeota archaeon]|nr:MAG: glutamine-hydrolyzing GMP synthase subunit GuaA [Candidatus Hydrothermarchaeota archaeon]
MFEPKKFISQAIEEIKKRVGDEKAIIALSGGVDSSVAAVLAHKALGENLVAVFVNHGFMRKGEEETIIKTFRDELGMNLVAIDAKEKFFNALKGVKDPEKKRKIIGELFIRVFEEVAIKENAKFLVQGTIAPDWIESEGGIKSHHNVAGLPSGMILILVEPLRDLYKDEVRKVARELGLPKSISERMPFPGPGLAVRVIGEVTPEKIRIVKEANAIVEEEIEKANLKPWQAFAVLLEEKTVGVKGDIRDYGYTIAVRVVESIDAMTATAMEVPWNVLKTIMKRITREIPEVTRVLYDITDKPPATIEFE